MIKRIFIIWFIGFFLFQPVTIYSLTQNEKDEILIGIIPEENIFRFYEKHLYLAEYLSRLLGRPVRLTILSRYGDVIDRFQERKMDGAIFGSLTGYIAIHKLGLKPLVVPVSKNGSYSSPAYVIVRKDVPFTSILDFRNSVAAFVDRATARGYLFLIAYLKRQGIKNPEKFFREVFFTGSHDAAVYAVADGRADITSVKAGVYEKLIKKEPLLAEELKIIARSEPFVDSVFCVKGNLAPESIELLLHGLTHMHENPEGIEVLKKMGINRFIKAEMKYFEAIDKLLREAGTDVKHYNYRISEGK